MKKSLYCSFDVISGQYGNIYGAVNDAAAIRQHEAIMDEVIEKNKRFNPRDYCLLRLGVAEQTTETSFPHIEGYPEPVVLTTKFEA